MTLPVENAITTFAGNGVALNFPIVWTVQRTEDLRVRLRPASGSDQSLELGTHFTVTLFAQGAVVTLLTGPLAFGESLIVERSIPVEQQYDLTDRGAVFPADLERTFDRIVMMIQDLVRHEGNHLALMPGHVNGSGQYDALMNRISNMRNPVDPQDAVTLSFLEGFILNVWSVVAGYTRLRWSHVGDGVETNFDITGAVVSNPDVYLVTIGGIPQEPEVVYTILLGLQEIEFVDPPPDGAEIVIRVIVAGAVELVPPRYSLATRPEASAIWVGRSIRIFDEGIAEYEQICLEGTTPGTYSWATKARGEEF